MQVGIVAVVLVGARAVACAAGGMGCNQVRWNGVGWDVVRWDGMGWDGMG